MRNTSSLVINGDFIQNLKCTRCGSSGTFEKKENTSYDSTFRCKTCGYPYYVKDGILNTLAPFDDNYWDNLYTKGLKGNPIHRTKQIRLVDKTLNNLPNSLLYFALVDLLRQVKAKFKVSIELGCGTGVYSLLLTKMRIVDVTILVDMSLPALKVAQNIFDAFKEKAFFVLADVTNLPFANKCFDFSLSGGLIEHFRGKQLRQIVSEHCRIVSNVACQFPAPTPCYWLQRNIISALNFGWPFGYELPLTTDMVKRLFQIENFQLKANSYHDMMSVLLTRATLPFNFLALPKQKGLLNKMTATESVMYFVQSAF